MEFGRLHFAQRVGAIMDSSEPIRQTRESAKAETSVNINSPNNRVASHDYIEVNIYVDSQRDGDAETNTKHSVSEIEKAVSSAVNSARQKKGE